MPAVPVRYYRPELDALRFVAFLSVFFFHGVQVNRQGTFHAHPLLTRAIIFVHSSGRFGLSLFFFLSSFLITTLLLLEKQKTGTLSLRSFYLRRMLRIWPLYFGFLFLMYALGLSWRPAAFSSGALASFTCMLGNWYVLSFGILATTVTCLWSISVEEQFYLIWPAVMRRLNRRAMISFSVALATASLAGIFLFVRRGDDAGHLWFSTVTIALFFATGALLALHLGLKTQPVSVPRFVAGFSICAVCWLVAVALGFDDARLAHLPACAAAAYALAALGSAALLWGFLHIPRRVLRPQFVYLGRISYGLYVFHGLALLLCGGLLREWLHLPAGLWVFPALLLSILLAVISYECYEKPFLRLKVRFERVPSRAV